MMPASSAFWLHYFALLSDLTPLSDYIYMSDPHSEPSSVRAKTTIEGENVIHCEFALLSGMMNKRN